MANIVPTKGVKEFRAISRVSLFLALGYVLLIVYASLSPFTGWQDDAPTVRELLFAPWPRYITRADILVNILAYVPLGFLLTISFMSFLSRFNAVIMAIILSACVSLGMEVLQGYLPARISSNVDLLTNSVGALLGAVLAARAGSRRLVAVHLVRLRQSWFLPESHIDMGVALLLLWFFSQLDPSLPLLGILFFSNNSLPIGGFDLDHFNKLGILSVTLNLLGVGLLIAIIIRSRQKALLALILLILIAALVKLVAAAILLKSEVMFQWMNWEVVIGIFLGLLFMSILIGLSRQRQLMLCLVILLASLIIAHIRPDEMSRNMIFRLFSWHHGQLSNYKGLAKTVAQLWPWIVLIYLISIRNKLSGKHK